MTASSGNEFGAVGEPSSRIIFHDCTIVKLSSPDEDTITTFKDLVGIKSNYSLFNEDSGNALQSQLSNSPRC